MENVGCQAVGADNKNVVRVFEKEIAGRPFKVEIGKMANLANGSALIHYGETVVLVTAVASRKPKPGIDFFPLTVEFEEKLYSVGKIPGGFIKREGRPSERATLTARLIDRPIRPLFPDGMKNEVQVVATVMSVDQDCTPDTVAMNGASIALGISDIPFEGPVAAVTVGYTNGTYIINPTIEQKEMSSLNLVVAGTKEAVVMVEAGADILPEDVVLGGIMRGHEVIQDICAFIEEIQSELGKEKFEIQLPEVDHDFVSEIEAFLSDRMNASVRIHDKHDRNAALDDLKDDLLTHFAESHPDQEDFLKDQFKANEKKIVRKMIINEGLRPDGRGVKDIRPVSCEVALLPRTHGSGLFTRGLTQALTITTLGALGESQRIDGLDLEDTKRYMHHYNFPPFSVGEVGMSRVNRRAIGHGALGERALLPVIPSEEDFPYTIRLVSEVVTCNGSSSQASICGSTLSLLDAGVPIKDSVAGIAMGLIQEEGKISILSDIQGMEDALGDMDFKVAGTKNGITALQMDIKVDGLSRELLENALEQARIGRLFILGKMSEVISEPRPEMSPYAPRVFQLKINPDKIRDVIGPGGKVITRITSQYDVKIDIDDDGTVLITANDGIGGEGAKREIEGIVTDPEVGQVFTGKVSRILKFGAFVDLGHGKEGLCHISQIDTKRIAKVEDVLNIGDEVVVKIIEIDDQGRINLSRKVLLEDQNKNA
ncbi:polyribonucleotide nucleotidyltransferase [Fusibacter tunisiensis]|uniref:Polyribonucleotide nucleotidyltransferase n=1 Tax=Fusibacter tunisiensis TaxID=1008308 RepID=A0ABS2MMK7_9FIRM|nr:polyribonucleotide nucleotidyltransferase [Fusibacter tunisiensis]MBM7560635.1 polyribonucleotide nucleotidyltransferase [Fusibacter tunisiensis]